MVDSFFIELVQDIPGAAAYELEELSQSGSFVIKEIGKDHAIITGDFIPVKQAAFVRKASKILSSADSCETLTVPVLLDGKFYVRFEDQSNCHDATIEPAIGEMLLGKGRISFRNPDFVIRVYHYVKWYICLEIFNGNRKEFEDRRAPMRPFFSPVSIHPRHARFMINVSGTVPGDTILDPFCGTGGILLEAGITGRHVVGNDWSLQMSTGAKLNLKYFGIRDFEVTNEDFTSMKIDRTYDAIVTDLPYGKNSRLSQKNVSKLYGDSFKKFHEILKESGKCVTVVSDLMLLKMSEPYFVTQMVFKYRVHRSLTRYFAVLVRKK